MGCGCGAGSRPPRGRRRRVPRVAPAADRAPARADRRRRPPRTASTRSSSPTSSSPDAVVIDLHMPLVDGVTAVARLRKDHPSLCLIALTGDPDRAAARGRRRGRRRRRPPEGRARRHARRAPRRGQSRPRRPARLAAASGEVAQLVEHSAENRGVAGSSPALAIPRESLATFPGSALSAGPRCAAPAQVGRRDEERRTRSLRAVGLCASRIRPPDLLGSAFFCP